MARKATGYDTASSQFFICHQDSQFLDGNYAAFGIVTEGMEVVDAICDSVKPYDENGSVNPGDQPVIEYIKLIEN
jgi:peptidyl-prolyl cis-trans isomerase B (cyclophilin B)